MRKVFFFSLLAAGVLAQAVFAHTLIRAETPPSSWGSAAPIRDPSASQVYYGRLDPSRPRIWFRFEGRAGDRISFSVGVPFVERLEGFQPRAAILGPGLPPPDLDFDVPPETGATVFVPRGEPRVFHEEFTGTTSWIVLDEEFTLPRAGTWYLVAYPVDRTAAQDKMWMSIGTREVFGLSDILGFFSIRSFVREFHELK